MYVQGSQPKAFGAKNVALIAVFGVILIGLAWIQRPARNVSSQNGLSLNKQNTDLFAQNAPSQPAVLGANEVNQDLLKQFSSIPVKVSSDTSLAALQTYADQVTTVEQADAGHAKIINDLSLIAAPEVFADYHRLTLAYYNLQFNSALNATDQQNAQVIEQAIQEQLAQIRTNFQSSAGVTLP